MNSEPVIGLEVHAELQTKSKMFCSCAVVDNTVAEPNVAVCPVCSGMPGTLPVVNQRAVEYRLTRCVGAGLRDQLHKHLCSQELFLSRFAERLSDFSIRNAAGCQRKSCHQDHQRREDHPRPSCASRRGYREVDACRWRILVDLNRAGVPLLEIVSEPDMRSVEEAKATRRLCVEILRYLGVNSGDMEKGVIRFELNVSVRVAGTEEFNTHVDGNQEPKLIPRVGTCLGI